MVPIHKMTQRDAQHTLEVHAWITEHLEEIRARAQTPRTHEVSASEVQEQFYHEYIQLQSIRFLPVKLVLFPDQDTLEAGAVTEPNVLLYRPLDEGTYVVADYFHTPDLGEIARSFGIHAQERTWKLSHS